jgi:hypothetical protein
MFDKGKDSAVGLAFLMWGPLEQKPLDDNEFFDIDALGFQRIRR